MREVALDERARLLYGVLVHPAHVLRLGPAVQRVRERDRRAHEDVVQHDQRREARGVRRGREQVRVEEQQGPAARGRVSERRSVRRGGRNAPHGAQGAVLVADAVPVAAALALRLVRHERAQRELELRHVARELELPGLAQRLRDRGVQHEGRDHVLHDRDRPGRGARDAAFRVSIDAAGDRCLPFAHELGDVELAEDLVLHEGELFHEVLHVRARATTHGSHRVRRVLPEVHAMQLREDRAEFTADRRKQRVYDVVKRAAYALYVVALVVY